MLLNLATQYPPVILCLDDLHWADEGTLIWLGYLARQLKHTPILVLGVYRLEEIASVTALRTELARLGLLQEIKLEGLSQPETLSLIRCLSGQSTGAELFSQRLHRETGGNPFFILETLRVLFEGGLLWQDEMGWNTRVDKTTKDYGELPLPDTVCEAIRVRVRRLSSQVQQVLDAGAVIGSQFGFDLVHATSGRQESEVIEALETLLARQIISEYEGKYRFNHNLIWAVVYRGLSYGRRRLLHRRAGEALEKLQPDDAATMIRHFERAEEPGRAAQYALQAGLVAKAVFAHTEARAYFDHALALLEQEAAHLREPETAAANYRLRIQTLAERGWALRLLGDMEAYARDSQEVAWLAGRLRDLHTLAHLRWREAYTHRWFCRYAEAREAAEECLRLSQVATAPTVEAMCQREVPHCAVAWVSMNGPSTWPARLWPAVRRTDCL
ncbi:MAG: hypothetical protein HYR94_12985 [Chloroflexi bacterium]|nr:hypothetical protein [Chloroflexota bacterium]